MLGLNHSPFHSKLEHQCPSLWMTNQHHVFPHPPYSHMLFNNNHGNSELKALIVLIFYLPFRSHSRPIILVVSALGQILVETFAVQAELAIKYLDGGSKDVTACYSWYFHKILKWLRNANIYTFQHLTIPLFQNGLKRDFFLFWFLTFSNNEFE